MTALFVAGCYLPFLIAAGAWVTVARRPARAHGPVWWRYGDGEEWK